MTDEKPHGDDGTHRAARLPFARHLLSAAPVLLLVTCITTFLSERGLLGGFESAALDMWLQVKAPRPVGDLVIVTIDDTDYKDLFGKKSPLAPDKVQELIAAVVAGGPSAVGVDLDTSEEEYAHLDPPKNVVWGRDGVIDEGPADHGGEHGAAPAVRPGPVLGREGAAAAGLVSGLALMPQDPDGIIRRYRHEIPILDEHGGHEEMPTLGWAVVRALPGGAAREASHHPLVLNFAGDRYAFNRLSARDVIAGAKLAAWATVGPLKNKVVLVGGTYRAARDEYITPVGAMPGVQLVAQAVESEIHGGGIRPLAHWLMTILEIASGILLVWINYRFRMATALMLSLVAMPLFSLFASLVAFSSLAFWFNFVPTLVGVWIHELIDHAREFRVMHQQLHASHH